jgi:F0F1-type ATP synthase delta subunit
MGRINHINIFINERNFGFMTSNQKLINRIETIDFKINRISSIIAEQPEMAQVLLQMQNKLSTEKQLLISVLKSNKIA